MKLILFSIFAVLLAAKNCEAFPYPIPEPKQSSEAATTLVMKSFAKEAKDYPPRWRDEAFAQSLIYTTFAENNLFCQAERSGRTALAYGLANKTRIPSLITFRVD